MKIREICGLVLSVHDRAAIQLGFRPPLHFVLATRVLILMLLRLKSFSFGIPREFADQEVEQPLGLQCITSRGRLQKFFTE
ncbi:MAG TPA: hypothetical protein VGW99_00400 [Chthoniobacterales bacterium]|nr:hypothetical protein [Chthoniobacterales bacterium]